MGALTLYNGHPVVHVPDEMWYRFEDQRYSSVDEWGEHSETHLAVELRKFWVHHHTPKGVWLGLFRGSRDRFVLKSATRKFACPTIALAKESFIARKRKQGAIYRARAAQRRACNRTGGEVQMKPYRSPCVPVLDTLMQSTAAEYNPGAGIRTAIDIPKRLGQIQVPLPDGQIAFCWINSPEAMDEVIREMQTLRADLLKLWAKKD